MSTVRLRGLPLNATMEAIKAAEKDGELNAPTFVRLRHEETFLRGVQWYHDNKNMISEEEVELKERANGEKAEEQDFR